MSNKVRVIQQKRNLDYGEEGHKSRFWVDDYKQCKGRPPFKRGDEQTRLFSQLPIHLKRMALFAVNTGCRDKEICGLLWDWELKVPELDSTYLLSQVSMLKTVKIV